ncbi:Zn(2)-C6 fungal-type DNA-binding domain protein [Akanthomyces lecanii RCEF 1005]|uniref:Zn(2)-C6 fungal-type DNA-binding domain protein n=1 Tax=Akanthomyces lecanii RCEF 1005 TaxID=1081108 RepID=A0A168BJB1_CORDF|nr:Zn(2)-C6 fungal-type DNA-binding domain protein [Akanthomyces lecanii RCEF 1005]
MVGVPGRSKGCRTCRRRKKGCDKAEPSCAQCLTAGLICEGYGRDLVWVNATTEEEPTGRQRRPPTNPSEPWQVRYAGQPGTNIEVILRESLAKTAREQKYLGMFWSAYLPNGRAFTSRACRLSTGGWTAHMGKLYDAEPTLRLASLAMSASVIGHQNHDGQLIIKGLKAYSEAIQEMTRAYVQLYRNAYGVLIGA